MTTRLLVGDIGGTKTALGVVEITGATPRLAHRAQFASARFATFDALARHYLEETGVSCAGAALAAAGPVQDGACAITNLDWHLDAARLAGALGLARVRLLNDLEAIGWGIPALEADDLVELHPGEPAAGNACIVAAGTGLGEAGLYWDGQRHHPFATEGGHADFSPVTADDCALLDFLRARHGRVSWERVVSGMGLANLFEFVVARAGEPAPDWLIELGPDVDLPEAVARAAAESRCPLCVQTMDWFARLYGREAGNLALKHLALGGVYLGGGIAPKNLPLLQSGGFLASFFDKGRLEPVVRRMPVRVIRRADTPLLGAARCWMTEA